MTKRIMFLVLMLVFLLSGSSYAANLPDGVPSVLETPAYVTIEQRSNEEGAPYFYSEYRIPASVLELDSTRPTEGYAGIDIQRKIDNGEWEDYTGGHLETLIENQVTGKPGVYSWTMEPEDEGGLGEVAINNHRYSFRTRLWYQYYYGDGPGEWDYVYSQWSNEVSVGSGSYYQGASSWAVGELNQAAAEGLITERIKDNMSAPITREEFAELAVKFYEKFTGQPAVYTDMSAFTDTTNPEIFKAYNHKIVKGVGNNKFAPNNLITREQMAVMVTNAIRAVEPTLDFSTAGVPRFADQGKISAWALESVKFANKNTIMRATAAGLINPQGTTTREQAVIMIYRAYALYK